MISREGLLPGLFADRGFFLVIGDNLLSDPKLDDLVTMRDFYCDEALSGNTPIEVVMETEQVLAFHHTRPYWPVHIVVVPKVHIPSLTNLGEHSVDVVHAVLEVVTEIARTVEKDHGACRVLTNLGAYQDSKHLHFHVNSGEPET